MDTEGSVAGEDPTEHHWRFAIDDATDVLHFELESPSPDGPGGVAHVVGQLLRAQQGRRA